MKETTQTRLKLYAMVFFVVFTIGFLLFVANRFEQTQRNIEQTKICLSATGWTYSTVQLFIQKNEGQWPTSWEDLDGITDPDRPSKGPFDAESIRQWVTVDFSIQPTDIIDTTPDTFVGIQPKRDLPEDALEYVHGRLIETVKRFESN